MHSFRAKLINAKNNFNYDRFNYKQTYKEEIRKEKSIQTKLPLTNKSSHRECPFCKSNRVKNKGIRKNKQRYMCKSCFKNWTEGVELYPSKPVVITKTERKEKETKREAIQKALSNYNAISMQYKGFKRTIYPYALNEIYCVAFCTYANDLRTFRIDKMSLVTSGSNFQYNKSIYNNAQKKIKNIKFK